MRSKPGGLVVIFLLFVIYHFLPTGLPLAKAKAHKPPAVGAAIAYVKRQLGKPYLWGGAGPDAFDCSGLMQQAYGWGASLRTSQDQWAGLHHVNSPGPGDLVFFAGLLQPGEQPPGHVGIVVNARKHLMIDAYGGVYGVEYDYYGPSARKQGLGAVWGYASPG